MQAEVVSLDVTEEFIGWEPEDWIMCPKQHGLMHHQPTQTDYLVDMPKRCYENPKLAISMFELEAKLVRIRDGDSMPTVDQQKELGRAAIAVFLIETGWWNPDIVHVDRPEDRVRYNATNKLTN